MSVKPPQTDDNASTGERPAIAGRTNPWTGPYLVFGILGVMLVVLAVILYFMVTGSAPS